MGQWSVRGKQELIVNTTTSYVPRVEHIDGLTVAAPGDAVWVGRHRPTGTTVRMVILDDPRISDDLARRAEHESRQFAGQRTHSALLRVIDVVEVDGSVPAVCTELHSLGSIGRIVRRTGPLTADDVAWIGRDAARGLATLHENRIAHLRISPSAIVLTEDRRVCLASFGALGDIEERLELIGSAAAWSTPDPTGGPSDDVYALGASLYTALTGQVPGVRPPMGQIPAALKFVLMGALQPDPLRRPSASALVHQFDAVVAGHDPRTVGESVSAEPAMTAAARRDAARRDTAHDITGEFPVTTIDIERLNRRGKSKRADKATVAELRRDDTVIDLTDDRRRSGHVGVTIHDHDDEAASGALSRLRARRALDVAADDVAPVETDGRIRPAVKMAALASMLVGALVAAFAVSRLGSDPAVDRDGRVVVEQPVTSDADSLLSGPTVEPVTVIPIDPAPIGAAPVDDPLGPTEADPAASLDPVPVAVEPTPVVAEPVAENPDLNMSKEFIQALVEQQRLADEAASATP
jgi:Protein kinase domain